MIDICRRQVLHLLLGDVEPDSVLDSGHGADRDGDFLASPKVPFLEEHMGYPVIAGIGKEAPHPPDFTVDGVDTITGPHLYLTLRNNVSDDHSPVYRLGADVDEIARAGGCVCLATFVYQGVAQEATAVGTFDHVAFLGAVKPVEFRTRTAQPDFANRSVDQV
ncbi:MAG TPA: hypothetical protein VN886_23245 [Acidimicrobiales bacterium]|nr:hypothetical protein [Acidimicrobiales bacterium]